MGKALVAFFSMKGQTISAGMRIVNQPKGNTQIVAEYAAGALSADLFEIRTQRTYPEDHMELIREAQREQNAGERPALVELPQNWERYDTILLGYPNWWGQLPMPVVSFLEQLDWTGKTVLPFCTSEGSGLSGTVGEIEDIIGRKTGEPLSVTGSAAKRSQRKVTKWAQRNAR